MKRTKVSIVIIVVGLLITAAGFVPLTRTSMVTEQKTKEITEYKEETRTKEEPYTEEQVVGTETKEEVLFREQVPVTRGSTLGKTFELTAGDIIKLKAHANDNM